MSFYTGTQVELLYAMPASGSAVTTAVASPGVVMGGSTAANPPYELPAGFFQPSSGNGPGKTLMVKGGGWMTTTTTNITATFGLYADPTANSSTSQVALCKGGFTTGTTAFTNLAWDFEVLITYTGTGSSITAGTFNVLGRFELGAANNAALPALGTFGATSTTLFAGIQLGAPQTAVNLTYQTAYYIEPWWIWSVVTGGPTITLTNYYVFGLN